MSASAPTSAVADLTARASQGHAHGAATASVTLDYESRFLRRKVLTLSDGRGLLVDLPRTTSLDHGSVLMCDDGTEIAVFAAPEPLYAVTGPDPVRLAWHIGNRHAPCQIAEGRLLIRRDPVLRDMLERLGATVSEVTEPFTPEGGAYGHGRTHGHDHSHAHGPDGHDHG